MAAEHLVWRIGVGGVPNRKVSSEFISFETTNAEKMQSF